MLRSASAAARATSGSSSLLAAVRAGRRIPGQRAEAPQRFRRLQAHELVLVLQGLDQGRQGRAGVGRERGQALGRGTAGRDLAVREGRAQLRHRRSRLGAEAPQGLGRLGAHEGITVLEGGRQGPRRLGGADLAQGFGAAPADDVGPVDRPSMRRGTAAAPSSPRLPRLSAAFHRVSTLRSPRACISDSTSGDGPAGRVPERPWKQLRQEPWSRAPASGRPSERRSRGRPSRRDGSVVLGVALAGAGSGGVAEAAAPL